MANPGRKMATVREVNGVAPIEGADRIEVVYVDGWQVVCGKGEYHVGDLVVFYEIDTFLPTEDEHYSFLAQRGETVMVIDGRPTKGHKLRTARLRGTYSQGLLMHPEDVMPDNIPEYAYRKMLERKVDVSKLVGVCEYYKPMPAMNAGFIGRYDPYIAPRTDAERVQNVDQRTWDLVRQTEYEVSVKVDGTSISMLWDDRTGAFRMFSHNNEFSLGEGMGKIAYDCAIAQGLVAYCERHHMVTLQAELCGPKIQSDRLALGRHRLFVFSVWAVGACRYVSHAELRAQEDAADVLESFVPIISVFEPYEYSGKVLDDFERPEDFLAHVDGIKGAVTKGRLDEGLVVHIFGPGGLDSDEWRELQGALGATMQVKAVSNKYLLKEK